MKQKKGCLNMGCLALSIESRAAEGGPGPMVSHSIPAAMALVALLGLSACQQQAPNAGAGAMFYRATCATCHEPGSRPQAPDLTGLAAMNGGRFPMDRVTRIIDGRSELRAHGSPMPVWGAILTGPEVRDLAAYLAAIQQ
ncbi:c-type cytochrome [Nioella sediminis]|jgi:mono/diheme cytochrome c family protein|uniref:c-type cytochrome n=1 Tax=Nioella sediminis TaxID=1912092 RepID=UPI001D0C03F6|nr:cytochrome c [Nioella sediminis]